MKTIANLKDASIEVIKNLPEVATIDDIMYQINLTAKVFKGLEDEQNDNVVSTNELLSKIKEWKK